MMRAQLRPFVGAAIDHSVGPASLGARGACQSTSWRCCRAPLSNQACLHSNALDDIKGWYGLFMQAKSWDHSKSTTSGVKHKAMFQLAGQAAESDDEQMLQPGELTHPILSSVRVLLAKKKKPKDSRDLVQEEAISATAVEAKEHSYVIVPNASIDAVQALMKCCAGTAIAGDCLATAHLSLLKVSS